MHRLPNVRRCTCISRLSRSSPILTLLIPSKLLEFPLQDDVRLTLGPATFEMDLPLYATFPLSAKAPLLYFDGDTDRYFSHAYERVVIDARTRAMYRFPAFSSGIVSSHPVIACERMLNAAVGWSGGLLGAVARLHIALREAHHGFSSYAGRGTSNDPRTGVHRSRSIDTPA